jgi:16S rRNA (cytosine967-C5)-methyltransferase
MGPLNDAWTTALEALRWVDLREMNEDAALRKALKQLRVKDRTDAEDARILLHEVTRRRNALDYIVNSALEPDNLGSLEVCLRSFIRLYAYMVHYSGGPYSNANKLLEHVGGILGEKKIKSVEEAIDLIPHQRIPWGSMSQDEELSYRYFLPVWYVTYLRSHFDNQTVLDLLQPVDTPKYIRVNTLKTDERLIDRLTRRGFKLDKVPELGSTYRVIGSSTGLTDTEPYREGEFILQDKASILVGEVAAPKPRDTVLDICAAPGVKTSHLAQLMGNQGKIISVDSDARRLSSWRRLIERMGVTNAESMLVDVSQPDAFTVGEADLVLLDPPCSGTGTFNTAPSGKWRITESSIKRAARLQMRLVENAAPHVKEGGNLVYSTCSLTVEENEGLIRSFLESHPEFKLTEAKPRIGAQGLLGLNEAQRLYPHIQECEGFFIARLSKG